MENLNIFKSKLSHLNLSSYFSKLTQDDEKHLRLYQELMQKMLYELQLDGFSIGAFLNQQNAINREINNSKSELAQELSDLIKKPEHKGLSAEVEGMSAVFSISINETKMYSYREYAALFPNSLSNFIEMNERDLLLFLSQFYAQNQMTLLDAFNIELLNGNQLGYYFDVSDLVTYSIDFVNKQKDAEFAVSWLEMLFELVEGKEVKFIESLFSDFFDDELTKKRGEYFVMWLMMSCFSLLEGYLNALEPISEFGINTQKML